MAKSADYEQRILNLFDGYVHGFHNDTTPRFDKAAAGLAWERTVDHFKQHL